MDCVLINALTCSNLLLHADQEKVYRELKEYTSGRKKVPVPTYFTGGTKSCSPGLQEALDSSDNQADIHCLGTAGLQKVNGVLVAFLQQEYEKVICTNLWPPNLS